MTPWKNRIVPITLVLVSFALCNGVNAATLEVYAAASLTDAFQQIGGQFTREHPGSKVEFNFGGSQLLRTQIEQGAPADVFASADTVQMNKLRASVGATLPKIFTHNTLVVIATKRNHRVNKISDLASTGVKVVLAGPTVPAGHYGNQMLTKLNRVYGPTFSARVQSNVVSQEINVRAVLVKVELGEADAGIVYVTDARSAKGTVRQIAIPRSLNVPAEYPIAVVSSSHVPKLAQSFVSLVESTNGQAILRHFGFQK